ncbi:MAG: phosphotriesterase [Deltaproteobacteria bacterium]|nr:phosphotriesterase [Deltaproteobacteria bacterium]MBW2418615.1 phosphotriesterase [Deltaproteobacteria bacterium]
MAKVSIQTVTGSITTDALGRTLMHEHLMVGYPGWQSDTLRAGANAAERFAICVDRIEEIKSLGFTSMLDPCPNDLGRDVEFMAKVAQKTGFQIICATGLYKEAEGGVPYWHFRSNFGPQVEAMTELFVRELEEGIGETGIRAGIIKVATGLDGMSDYERGIFEAAARAAVATGAPITTHTDGGSVGDVQQKVLGEHGVAPHRVVIGHSCGSADHDYHMGIARGGSYLGFDRFGLEALQPDAARVASLIALVEAGAGDRVVVSHDSVWCWLGQPFPPEVTAALAETWNPSHFSRRIVPMLKEQGIDDEQIDQLLVDNPRRLFEGEPLSALA